MQIALPIIHALKSIIPNGTVADDLFHTINVLLNLEIKALMGTRRKSYKSFR